jgi:hypothetical protein
LPDGGVALCHLYAGRVETAIGIMEQVYRELPSYGTGVQALILAYWAAGRVEEAKAMGETSCAGSCPTSRLAATLESSPYKRAEQRQLMSDAFRGAGLPD